VVVLLLRQVHYARSIRGEPLLLLLLLLLSPVLCTVSRARCDVVAGILDKKKKVRAALETVGEDEVAAIPTIAPPVNQVYDKEDQGVAGGGAKKKGIDPSNLPYLHRNPAI